MHTAAHVAVYTQPLEPSSVTNSRYNLVECPQCGMKARVAAKWLDRIGRCMDPECDGVPLVPRDRLPDETRASIAELTHRLFGEAVSGEAYEAAKRQLREEMRGRAPVPRRADHAKYGERLSDEEHAQVRARCLAEAQARRGKSGA